jgi:hypothetical protein
MRTGVGIKKFGMMDPLATNQSSTFQIWIDLESAVLSPDK